MLSGILLKVSLVMALGLAGVSTAAQEAVALHGDVKVVRVAEQNGSQVETLEDPEKVVPGDRLVFTTSYHNGSTEVVENFVVTNPLPGAVALAQVGDFDVSVDDGTTFGELAALEVVSETGMRPAELSDVTHIRWVLQELEPQTSGILTYSAVVR